MAWDAYWRLAYDHADKVLQVQANELLRRGNITNIEFEEMVRARNTLVEEFRKPLSPFAKQYSEILKPSPSSRSRAICWPERAASKPCWKVSANHVLPLIG
jgi:hypothetical protein